MKTADDFEKATELWRVQNRLPNVPSYAIERHFKVQHALYALWWFTENVTQEDPDRNDLFFKVRELTREALTL